MIISDLFSVSFLIYPKHVFVLISVYHYIGVPYWPEPLSQYVELELFFLHMIYLKFIHDEFHLPITESPGVLLFFESSCPFCYHE